MAAVFAMLVHGFSDFSLDIPANALLFTVILTFVSIPSVVGGRLAAKHTAYVRQHRT
jgi:hypothetical protein